MISLIITVLICAVIVMFIYFRGGYINEESTSLEVCVGCPYEDNNIICLTEYVKNNYGEQEFEFEVVSDE